MSDIPFRLSHRRAWLAATAGSLVACTAAVEVKPVRSAPPPRDADDTARLQEAIWKLSAGEVLDGNQQQYTVTRLLLKSGIEFRNFRLRAKGTAVPLDSVLTIDGNATPAHDIAIRNVHIDGNRRAQSRLLSEEDGGRDGIRIVGKAEAIFVENCSAIKCATDGLKIFSHRSLSRDDAKLNFRNIYVVRCKFLNNRRHGASGDSLENVHFIDCEFSGNGVDMPGAHTEGDKGAIDNGTIYGAGVDIEGYGVGSGVNGLYFTRCRALGNARFGFQFWEPTPSSSPLFLPRRNIVFEGCTVDGGVSPGHGHQALELSQPAAVRSNLPTYADVSLIDLDCSGTVILNCVHNVTVAGGRIRSPYRGFWGVAERCTNLALLGVEAEGKILARKS